MDNNKTVIVVVAVLLGAFVLFKSGLLSKSGSVGGDDMRGTAAVSLAAGTFSGDAPSPDPGPNPSPDEKPFQKDCDVCKGTGYVKHGDGHVTKCPNCKPNPSEPAPESFDVQAEVDAKVQAIAEELKQKLDAREAEVKAQLEEAAKKLEEATKPAPEPVKETIKVNAFASDADLADKLMLQASDEFIAGRYAEAGELVKRAREVPNLPEQIHRRIAKASELLKEHGINVEPVYVVPKKEYDAKMAKIEALRKDNEALKKWGLEWQAHSKAQQQSYPAAWKNSYGQSYSDGGCSSGSCGGGGRMMMRGGGGGCSGGSCGGGSCGGGGCGIF